MKPWQERDPQRLEVESNFWTYKGFLDDSRGGQLAFRGQVHVQAGTADSGPINQDFEVRVVYPDAFPYRPATVELIDPRIRRARHQSPGGDPCLMPPRAWDPFELPAVEIYKALLRWLKAHLVGSFPREQAIYELPEYFSYSPLSVLIPEKAQTAFAGKSHGTFSIQEAQGRDLAVLRGVDATPVGRELISGLRLDRDVKQTARNGKWFRLDQEPKLVQYTGELQAFLAEQGHQLSVSRKPETAHGLIGLVFPDQVLGQERFLLLDYRVAKAKARPDVRGWPLACPWAFPVAPHDLFLRLQGVNDVAALQETNVVLLGVGAIGSSAAGDLARAGVGGLVLCDPDRLRPGNVMRHELDLCSVGQNKAEAMDLALGRINPFIRSRSESTDLLKPGTLANLMRTDHPLNPADLVISAIGDNAIEGLVSEVTVSSAGAPVLFVRTLHDGAAVRMSLLRPGENDACIQCLDLHDQDRHPDLIFVPDGELAPVFDAGCATASLPGAGLTSRQAALFAARRSLSLLLAEPQEHNQWLWVAEPIPDAEDSRLHQAARMYPSQMPRHPQCPICN